MTGKPLTSLLLARNPFRVLATRIIFFLSYTLIAVIILFATIVIG